MDAEVKIGELMAAVPKATKGNGSNQYAKNDTAVDFSKHQTKAQVIENAGFTVKQVQRFQTLAAHPDIVEQAKAEARGKPGADSRTYIYFFFFTGLYLPIFSTIYTYT